jgi:hypothetical protein
MAAIRTALSLAPMKGLGLLGTVGLLGAARSLTTSPGRERRHATRVTAGVAGAASRQQLLRDERRKRVVGLARCDQELRSAPSALRIAEAHPPHTLGARWAVGRRDLWCTCALSRDGVDP